MEGDTSENRRGGGLRKVDREAYHAIFYLFFLAGVYVVEESHQFY